MTAQTNPVLITGTPLPKVAALEYTLTADRTPRARFERCYTNDRSILLATRVYPLDPTLLTTDFAAAAPVWQTTALPAGVHSTPYTATLKATSDLGTTVAYALKTGTLPTGLSLDADTGVISGTLGASTASGSPYTLVFTATDNSTGTLATDKSVTLTVT